MPVSRRILLGGLVSASTYLTIAGRAAAAPILSPDNFGLGANGAARSNAWLEIDAAQFSSNIKAMKDLLEKANCCAMICVVMKADAYGHGIELLMPSVVQAAAPYIGITSNNEARIVRDARFGFSGKLIRLRAAAPDEIVDGLDLDIEELVGNIDEALMMSDIAARRKQALRVHFVLNSAGMSRDGLELGIPDGRTDAIDILRTPNLKVVGLMTHYPEENIEDIRGALGHFNADVAWLIEHAPPGTLNRTDVTIHSANSYAALNVSEARQSMVRVGGAVYGDTDPMFPQFRRIMTLKTRVASINHYPRGDTVSYDRTFRLERDSWLANITIGYSDGYRRVFSHANAPAFASEGKGRCEMLIGGRRAPIVGRVTMNTVMVDVTDFACRPRIGDEVVVYGRQGDDEITQAELERDGDIYGPDFYTVWGNSLPKMLKS